MKLNQDMKASIILGLAGISDTLSLNQYAMPKFKNSRIYTIKSEDESIDITLNFAKPYNLDKELQTLLEYLGENEFGINIDSDASDEETLCNTCNILNAYKSMISSLNSIDPRNPKTTALHENSLTIANWWDSSTSTTKESRVLAGTCAILYNLTEPSNTIYELSGEELYYKLIKEIAGFSEFIKDYKQEHKINWDTRKREPVNSDDIIEESNLLTIATLSELISCSFSIAHSIENTGFFKYSPTILDVANKLSMEDENVFYMHDREHKDKDLRKLKKDIYSILFASIGYTEQPIKSMRKAEEYDDMLGEIGATCYNTHALGSSYEMYEMLYPEMNLHMQKVIETLILNHASLLGVQVPGFPTISPDELTYNRLADITKINYELITTPSSRPIVQEVFKIASKEAQKNRKTYKVAQALNDAGIDPESLPNADPEETIEDYLNRMMKATDEAFEQINEIRKSEGKEPIDWRNDEELGPDEYPDIDADDMENGYL